jgi:hypothetical protein
MSCRHTATARRSSIDARDAIERDDPRDLLREVGASSIRDERAREREREAHGWVGDARPGGWTTTTHRLLDDDDDARGFRTDGTR